MHREPLLRLLAAHQPLDQVEQAHLEKTLDFVRAHPDCFERRLEIGHITGSAWIVSPDRGQVLLTHHQKLNRWLQPGGHADGNPDVLAVARQEAHEETGLAGLRLLSTGIFDIDVHLIRARLQEAAHHHYDIRFIFEADPAEALVISPESRALAWVPLAHLDTLNIDASLARMAKKTGGHY